MADKLLLSVSARQVSAAHWHRGRFARCEVFAHDEDGLNAFKSYLAQVRNLPVYMLVDAVEEDYRVESLPHAFGGDRSEMVKRKLSQHYRNTSYFSARLQGRDTGKRRDDRYLFCALTNPGLIAGWVQAIAERNLPIAGIYLLPAVSPALVEKLQLKQPNLLVVADSSGLRLTCLRDQKLRLSRLARVESSGPHAIKNYAEEISNTRLYLHALRVMTLDEQLSVLIIDRDDSLIELAQTVARDNPNIECSRLGHRDIIEATGISAAALDSSSDALYLHLLGWRAPKSNLAPLNITSGYRQHQKRHGIYAASILIAFAIVVWCGFNWYQIFDTKFDAAAAAQETAQLQAQYREATRLFPAAPTSAENLQRAVEISQKIGATTRSPETMMNVVSRALDLNPSIVLVNFGWKYGPTDMEPDPTKSAQSAGAATAGSPAASRHQSGLIEGEVQPFRGDYRAAIDTINGFADALLKQPEVAQVNVVKLPLNISPGLTLSGNTTDSPEQSDKAEFKLLLVLKPIP